MSGESRLASWAVLAAAAVMTSATSLVAQARLDVVEAQVAGRSVTLDVSRHRAFPAVNAADLAPVWGDAIQRGAYLRSRLSGGELAFEAGSPFFQYGRRTYQLANAPYQWGGAFWLPAEWVTAWLGAATSGLAVTAGADEPGAVNDEPLPARIDPGTAWRVIIDPGHGGRDPGTQGRQSDEKDVVLSIGLRLHEELQGRDMIEPYLTRDTDVYIEHDLRSQYAVDRGGDLFVSIHANGVTDRRARGFETIFLGPARSEEAREVALRENRVPELDGAARSPSDIQFILTGLDRTDNLAESRLFAGFVQNQIRDTRSGRSPDRGVKQGPWWVLLGALARMPSVIVEVGFLSNEGEERYLDSADGQRALARAIADAIVEYRSDILRRYAGSGGGR